MTTSLPGSSDSIIRPGKFVYLSDWDGTITTQDSNDYLVDNFGFGEARRKELNKDILSGATTFRDAFHDMLHSVKLSFPECMEVLKRDIVLDPGFKQFYFWAKEQGIPVIIVSSGMAPLIRAVLANLIGDEEAEQIDVIANDVKLHDPEAKKWEIVYRHPESGFGHDKSKAILPYRDLAEPPVLFFSGDGVSDMSAARHADYLFVRRGKDLERYVLQEKLPHETFDSFLDIQSRVNEVKTEKGAANGHV